MCNLKQRIEEATSIAEIQALEKPVNDLKGTMPDIEWNADYRAKFNDKRWEIFTEAIRQKDTEINELRGRVDRLEVTPMKEIYGTINNLNNRLSEIESAEKSKVKQWLTNLQIH